MARTALARLVAGLLLVVTAACGGPPVDGPEPPESGSVLWTRQFASPGRDFAFALATGPGNAIAVAGGTFGALGGASNGDRDAFVLVLDGEGRTQWARQLGVPQRDSASAVAFGPGGAVVIGGSVEGPLEAGAHQGDGDAFVRVYEADGSVRWTRQFGSIGLDFTSAVAFTADGGVVAAGGVGGALDGGAHEGGFDAFVRRFDADGNVAWSTTFGTSLDDSVNAIAIDPDDGRIYVVGGTEGDLVSPGSHLGERDAFVLAFTDAGAPIPAVAAQFGSDDFDTASGAALAPDGSLVVVGYTRGALPGMSNAGGFDTFVRVYEATHAERWTRQAGSLADDFARDVAVGSDGTIALAGQSYANFGGSSAGESDAFVRTYAPNGDVRWSRLFGTSGEDAGYGVAFLGSDAIVTAGHTDGALEGDGAGDDDVFVRVYAR
jgi:hypothetical protein